MALTVNTLGEVPEGEGYIVEIGLEENQSHPANEIDRDRIRDEMEGGEWYVRTGDQEEEQQLMLEVDDFDHSRLPAYVVLSAHPTKATRGIAIYLDEIETEDEAWWVLQLAISELRSNVGADSGDSVIAERIKSRIASTERPLAIGASAVSLIEFGVSTLL